jgi:hypothetical protein
VRALIRYLLITGILVGLAWGCFALPIRGRTVFGHIRALGESRMSTVLARIKADLDARIARRELEHRPKEVPPPKKTPELHPSEAKKRAEPPRVSKHESDERARQDQAMARLEAARGQLSDAAPHAVPRTHVDERIPAGSERAVSELVRRRSTE